MNAILSYTKHQTDRTTIGVYDCMDFGTGSFPIVLNFVWSLLFSLFLYLRGGISGGGGYLDGIGPDFPDDAQGASQAGEPVRGGGS